METVPSLKFAMTSIKKKAIDPASCANEYNLVMPPTVPDAIVRIDALDKSPSREAAAAAFLTVNLDVAPNGNAIHRL
jgi:hypothetical protein